MADVKQPQNIQALLDYDIANDSGIIVNRRSIEYFADRTSYQQNDTLVINFNTGIDFIYGPNCRIEGEFLINGDAAATTFEPGDLQGHSVASLVFKDIRLVSDSAELSDEHDVHKRIDMVDSMSCDADYLQTEGSVQGYFDQVLTGGGVSRFSDGAGFANFSIPMHHLIGFFRQNTLIPSGMMSGGLRLEIVLQPEGRVAVWSGVSQTYNLNNVRIVTDSYTLSEDTMDQLQQVELETGIDFTYDTYTNSTQRLTNSGKNTIDLLQSVNRALSVYARVSSVNDQNDDQKDFLKAIDYSNVNSWRFRVGSEFIPSNTDVLRITQSYNETLKSFNNLSDCTRPPSLTLERYKTLRHVIGGELERDIVSEDGASGVQTRTNNHLSLDIDVTVPGGDSLDVYVYLNYQRALKLLAGEVLESS